MRHSAVFIAMFFLLAGNGQAASLRAGAGDTGIDVAHADRLAAFQGSGMTLEQAVAQVRRQYPGGKIVSAETRVSGGRETHVIKVLTEEGTVKTVRVPGRST